jgi:sugar phosphate isomerase/epimerase
MAQTKLKIGVMTGFGENPEESIQKVQSLGLPSCQMGISASEPKERFKRLMAAAEAAEVEITTFWVGLPGPSKWNFLEGPGTIGFVPEKWRAERVEAVQKGARLAGEFGVASVTTHAGFIPENPGDPVYAAVVAALKEIALVCKEVGVEFWFETGQETPVCLLRTIQDIGTGNLGINLDPANLLMYGRANPIDALDVFGQYVRGVHAKDGEYPTNGRELGVEKPLGQGRVNFPVLIPKLKALGFRGALTIEREIKGPKQTEDIMRAIELLKPLC